MSTRGSIVTVPLPSNHGCGALWVPAAIFLPSTMSCLTANSPPLPVRIFAWPSTTHLGQRGLVAREIQETRLGLAIERDGGGGRDLPVAGQHHRVAGVGGGGAADEQVAGDGDHARGLVELEHAAC